MPITEPVLLILLSLVQQPRHGYAILQDTLEMSEGRVRLSTGTCMVPCDGCWKIDGSSASKSKTARGVAKRTA